MTQDINHLPDNPPAVIDGFCSPHPVTLGQLALLEKINSPFLGKEKNATLLDLLPSLYLLSMPAKEGLFRFENLDTLSIVWADDFTLEEMRAKIASAQAGIQAFYAALPRATDEDSQKSKKAFPAMVSC